MQCSTPRGRKSWPGGRWIVAASAAVVLVCTAAAPVGAQSITASSELAELAETGRFGELLDTLQQRVRSQDAGLAASLIDDLERHQTNQAARDQQRAEGYREALDAAAEELEAGNLEDAMVQVIEAHGLSADPRGTLLDPLVRRVAEDAEADAVQAEQEERWLDALGLYRLLDLLYEQDGRYKDELKRVRRHVRVLQMYAPEVLERLYAKRAERRGKDASEFGDTEPTDWRTRLAGISEPMLRQALAQAVRRHVNKMDYRSLMRGATEGLLIFLDTEGLEGVFPSFSDPVKRKRFRDLVQGMRHSIDQPASTLGPLETATMIDQIMAINRRTLELPESVLVYELTQGAIDTLDDFSSVYWPEDKEHFSRITQGKFFGVGIQIARRDDQLLVVSPLENTPAQRAGLRAGDVIVEVDGRPAGAWSLDRAVREITGPEGTFVKLGIERVGETDMLEFSIQRAEINMESIRGWEHRPQGGWDYWIDRTAGIGYVRMSSFIPQTADDLDTAIEQLQREGHLNGLILDLRFNPGGLLSSAIEVVDRFISSGPIVATVDGNGRRTNSSPAHRSRTYRPFPVVVLINQGSASASEIVSGALQDYGRALIVGSRSFGKGSVQDLFPLAQGDAYLRLTTQYYMLPQGRIIHRKPDATRWGVDPDLVVEMTDQQVADSLELRREIDIVRDADEPAAEDGPAPRAAEILARGLDPQLEAALLVLKTSYVARSLAMAASE